VRGYIHLSAAQPARISIEFSGSDIKIRYYKLGNRARSCTFMSVARGLLDHFNSHYVGDNRKWHG
jgi:hypothetical protein